MDDDGPPCKRCTERNLGCVLNKSLQTLIDEKSQYYEPKKSIENVCSMADDLLDLLKHTLMMLK